MLAVVRHAHVSEHLDGCDFSGDCPADYDFDSPNAFDHEELVKCMQDLQVLNTASACTMTMPSFSRCVQLRSDMLLCCLVACARAGSAGIRHRRSCRSCTLTLRWRRPTQAMRAVEVPEYDFVRHQRSARTQRVEPADVVIIEGILVLHEPLVCGMLNMKIFVDTDDDVRLARR